jgi:hypothetical protein
LIVSLRHLDAIIKIRKSDGAILWKLGGTQTDASLKVSNDDRFASAHLGGQHDARVLADSTVSAYDNGSGYPGRRPRVTRWSIDPIARVATLVESFEDPDIRSAAVGSARKLSDGGWLVAWGHYPYVRAYTAAHKRIFSLNLPGGTQPYRASPIPSTLMKRGQLVSGMDAQYPR